MLPGAESYCCSEYESGILLPPHHDEELDQIGTGLILLCLLGGVPLMEDILRLFDEKKPHPHGSVPPNGTGFHPNGTNQQER
jgi:hypothetical protein